MNLKTIQHITFTAVALCIAGCAARPSEGRKSATVLCAAKPPASEVATLAADIAPILRKAPYMQGKDLGTVAVPGWKGFPARKWSYTLYDKNGAARTEQVIMLNPDANKLAAWILSASYEIKGSNDAKFCDKLFKHVISCSGGQFAVRGIVLEDMDKDGIHKAYPFQDGVTVQLKQIPGFPERQLTPGEQSAALNSTQSNVTHFHKKARLQSSEPEHWALATKTPKASGGAWLNIVRKEYQRAWNSDTNAMLTATAKTLGL